MAAVGSPEKMSPFSLGSIPSQQLVGPQQVNPVKAVPAMQSATPALSSGELEILTRVVKQYVIDPMQRCGANPSVEQVGCVYQNIIKSFPQDAGTIKENERTEERKRINTLLMTSARKECSLFGKFLVAAKQAASIREAGEKLTNVVGGLADTLGCIAYVELNKKPIDTTGLEECFQRLSLTEAARVGPSKVTQTVKVGLLKKATLNLKYPLEYYKWADEGVGDARYKSYEPCIARINSPDEDLRLLSQLETEYLISVFDDMLRNPIKRLGDLKKLPPQELISHLHRILESCYPLVREITQKPIPKEYVSLIPGTMFGQGLRSRVENMIDTLYIPEKCLIAWLVNSGNGPDKQKMPSLFGRKLDEFETNIFIDGFSQEAFHRMQKNKEINLMKLSEALRQEFNKRHPGSDWDWARIDPTGTQIPTW